MARKSKAFGAKRKPTGPKANPFDFKFERKRHNVRFKKAFFRDTQIFLVFHLFIAIIFQVLGSNKNGVNATPLGSRKISHDLRKRTIGNELRLLNKQNKVNFSNNSRRLMFVQVRDQRIGQQNPNLTAAQKAELRLIAQRKHSAKKSKFLLNDDDGIPLMLFEF